MTDSSTLHQNLVDRLVAEGQITSPAVEGAFRAVPRHLFLPQTPVAEVYRDEAIPTKRRDGVPISSSSQPAVMAIMLEQLEVEPGHRVLEIGAGTGYNAALLVHLAGERGEVVTIDVDDDLVEGARRHLATAGLERVRVVRGDGAFGYPDGAPYDRIVLTVGAWDIAPAWWWQLAPGGRLLLPLWLRGTQLTVAFEPADGHLASVSVSDCSFMRLRGAFAGPEGFVCVGPEDELTLSVEDRRRADPTTLQALLAAPARDLPLPVNLTPGDAWGSLSLWVALHEEGFCNLSLSGERPSHPLAPLLLGISERYRWTLGLSDGRSLAILIRLPAPPASNGDQEPARRLAVRAFGPDDALAHRLVAQIAAWDAAGRLAGRRPRLRAYPLFDAPTAFNGAAVIDKRETRLVIDWTTPGMAP